MNFDFQAIMVLALLVTGVIWALDACVLIVYESRYRTPEMRVQSWVDRQAGKAERALAVLEAAPPPLAGTPHVGHITLAYLLGYRDLRFDANWRTAYPRLHAWHAAFAAGVPAFAATAATA